MNRVRSLNLEHVSPAKLRSEISRRAAHAARLARKPDAGLVLTDERPATLLQVMVSDDRFAAREEDYNLPVGSGSRETLVVHLRNSGRLSAGDFAS